MAPQLLTRFLLFLLPVFLLLSCANHKKNSRLELVKAYELQTYNSIEPSGLTEWDGEFYTVSDKHNAIYQLVFNGNKIDLKLIIKIHHHDKTKLDFEGITHDDEFFYLISEASFQILKVAKDGKQQEWFPMNQEIMDIGKSAGLFQIHNANFEGICIFKNNSFLLAAERQPRGFVEYKFNGDVGKYSMKDKIYIDKSNDDINAYQVNEPVYQYENNRSPDFTGLSCSDGIYVLDRNAYMVAELKKVNGKYKETKGYSYEHVVSQHQYKYQDMEYGHAEGLVVNGNRVYIIIDNNKDHHVANPEDNNSLFFEFKK